MALSGWRIWSDASLRNANGQISSFANLFASVKAGTQKQGSKKELDEAKTKAHFVRVVQEFRKSQQQ